MLERIISFVAPHLCFGCGNEGSLLCEACAVTNTNEAFLCCYKCNTSLETTALCKTCTIRTPLAAVFAAGSYQAHLEQLIHVFKFARAKAAVIPLVGMLDAALPFLPEAIVVPVPTAAVRIRQRGYDQTLLLAKGLAKKRSLSLNTSLRRNHQKRQLGASRKQRLQQARDAFRVKQESLLKDAVVILVDDVLTTGATLEAAANCLKAAGAKKIYGLIVAQRQDT